MRRARAEAQWEIVGAHLARQEDAGGVLAATRLLRREEAGARCLDLAGKTAGKGFCVEEGRGEIHFGP